MALDKRIFNESRDLKWDVASGACWLRGRVWSTAREGQGFIRTNDLLQLTAIS